MAFIQQPAYILAALFFLVLFSEWLATKKFFKHIGAVLIIIIAAAIVANLKLIPSSTNAPPVYDKIFEYAAPLGIFFLLLKVRLKDIKLAGLPMLTMFTVGCMATVFAVIAGYFIVSPQQHMPNANAIAGMFTGTYIGGSANLNAVALQYSVQKDGNLYAAVNAVDNIITAFWIFMTIFLPPVLQKKFPRKKKIAPELEGLSSDGLKQLTSPEKEAVTVTGISLLLALGFGSLCLASLTVHYFPKVPSILVLTSLAILLAQFKFVQQLQGSKVIGMVLILLFLAVIGAYCDIAALMHSSDVAVTLFLWDGIFILLHGLLIFGIGGLLKQDWDIIAVASNAGVGGATSAPVCAASLGRPDLQVSGIIAGSIGLAIGSYVGILVAELLK